MINYIKAKTKLKRPVEESRQGSRKKIRMHSVSIIKLDQQIDLTTDMQHTVKTMCINI